MAEQKVSVIMELVDKMSDGLKKINVQATALATGAVALLTAAVYKGVEAFAEAEKSSSDLAAAMKNGGTYTKEASKELEAYANALQKKTTYDDEAIVSSMAIFSTYGATVEQTKALTEATMDLASAKGIDIQTAAEMVNKSIQMGTAIRGVAVDIQGAAGSAERMDSTIKGLGDTFGGRAKAEAATFQGSMKQLQNAIGDLFEKIGALVAPAIQAVAQGLTSLLNWFGGLNPVIQNAILIIAGLVVGLIALVPVIIAVSAGMGLLSGATAAFGAVAAVVFAPITLTILAIAAAVAAVTYGVMKLVEFLKGDVDKQIADTEKKIDKLKAKRDEIQKGGVSEGEKGNNEKVLKDLEELENQKTELINTKEQERADAETVKGEEKRALKQQELLDDAAIEAEMTQAIKDEADARLQQWDLTADERRAIELQKDIDMEKAKGDNANKVRVDRLMQEKATMDLKVKAKETEAKMYGDWETFMMNATTSKNKEVQAVAKALAIKNIISKTAEAAMNGFNSMSMIPIIGVPLGLAMAAVAIAFGAEQIQNVQALADGGSFIADQPTTGNIGGQNILFGEAGREAVTFQPLDGKDQGGGSSSDGTVLILTDDGTELCKAMFKKQKELEAKGVVV